MIELIDGHDAVVGWRMKRRDTFVRRGWGRWGDAPYTDLMAGQVQAMFDGLPAAASVVE